MDNPRWSLILPNAVPELRRLGLITEEEARHLTTVPKGTHRGALHSTDGAWCVFDGERWVPYADHEAAITRSQQWLDDARVGR